MDDAVERQVRAYNAHDVDAFVACYADGAVLEDGESTVLMSGRDERREKYGRRLAQFPDMHAEIVARMRVGSYVVDEERVTGGPGGDVHAIAVYRLDEDGLIDRVRLLR